MTNPASMSTTIAQYITDYILPFVLLLTILSAKRCDALDGKVEDSGLKGPGFNPWLRQEQYKNISSCFQLEFGTYGIHL